MVRPFRRLAALSFLIVSAGGVSTALAESRHVFGIHFWDAGANVDVMSHEGGWDVEANLGKDWISTTRYEDIVGEGFTIVQRLDWTWSQTVPVTPAEQDTFADQCRTNWARRIKPYCRHYCIGNEMEIWGCPDPADYVAAFQKVRNAIKAEQPEARVIIGHFNDTNHARQAMQALGRDGYDGLAIHTQNAVPTGLLDMLDDSTLHNGQSARPEVGVYITEWGWEKDSNANAMNVMRAFYEALGASNAGRSRQVFCACWFVYWPAYAWDNFSLQQALIDNPAFEAATALGTTFNSYSNNPILVNSLYADVHNPGSNITLNWTTNVTARTQAWWRSVSTSIGQSSALNTSLTTGHQHIIPTSPGQVYEVMPISTKNDYGDVCGRRYRVKSGPWSSTAQQTIAGRVAVSWNTDWPSDSIVEYGPTVELGSAKSNAQAVTSHLVEISSLDPGQYYYRVLSSEANPDPNGARLYMRSSIRTFSISPMMPGDTDGDCDVDQDDFGYFQVCLTGQGIPQTSQQCTLARLDTDEDVDAGDITLFLKCLSGSGVCGDPNCLGS